MSKRSERRQELKQLPTKSVQELMSESPGAVAFYSALVYSSKVGSTNAIGTRDQLARRTGLGGAQSVSRYLKILEQARWINRRVLVHDNDVRRILIRFILKSRRPPTAVTEEGQWRGTWRSMVRRVCRVELIGSQRRDHVKKVIIWAREHFEFPKLRCGDADSYPMLKLKNKFWIEIQPDYDDDGEDKICIALSTHWPIRSRDEALNNLLYSTERRTDQLDASVAALYKSIIEGSPLHDEGAERKKNVDRARIPNVEEPAERLEPGRETVTEEPFFG